MKKVCLSFLLTSVLLHAAPNEKVLSSYGKLPLAFEENRGQAPVGVSYLARTRSGVVLLRPESMALDLDTGRSITMLAGEQKLPALRVTLSVTKVIGYAAFPIMRACVTLRFIPASMWSFTAIKETWNTTLF